MSSRGITNRRFDDSTRSLPVSALSRILGVFFGSCVFASTAYCANDALSISLNNAAAQAKVESVRLILTQEVEETQKDTALRYAIVGGTNRVAEREQIIELLLSHGADIDNQVNSAPNTPVMMAFTPDLLEFLLAHGANGKAKRPGSELAQAFACDNRVKDHIAMIQVLIARKIDISGAPSRGENALWCAVNAKQLPLADLLLSQGVGVNELDAQGRTVIFYASDRPTIELLIKHGANVNAVDRYNQTPYDFAKAAGNMVLVTTLQEMGAGSGVSVTAAAIPVVSTVVPNIPVTKEVVALRETLMALNDGHDDRDINSAVALFAALQLRVIGGDDPTWKGDNPNWKPVFNMVRDDLKRDLKPVLNAQTTDLAPVWDRTLAAHLSTAEINGLLSFYRADVGRSYLAFQKRLISIQGEAAAALIVAVASGGIEPDRALESSPPSKAQMDGRDRVIALSWISKIRPALGAVGSPSRGANPSEDQSLNDMTDRAAVKLRGPELDALSRKYQRDFTAFVTYQESPMAQALIAVYGAMMKEAVGHASSGGAAFTSALEHSVEIHTPAWKAAYEAGRAAKQSVAK
jgi:ankyrin repeat protein